MKKSKGFTIIEILAVVAVIAVLILIAIPIVSKILDSSTKTSFKNEVTGFVSDFDKAFNDKKVSESIASEGSCNKSSIYSLSTNDAKYTYLCMTLNDLKNEGYIKNNLNNNYGGYIQMWIPEEGGETITFINVTNGNYYIQGRLNDISKVNYNASKKAYEGKEIQKPIQSTLCPEDCGAIPGSNIINK